MSEPREVLIVHRGWWRCDRDGCSFRRFYATDKGALHGIAKHMRLAHGVRVALESWAGPRRLFVRRDPWEPLA